MRDKESNIESQREEILAAFSLLEDDILLYKKAPHLTSFQMMQAFLMTRRMITKFECQDMICDIQEIASNLPEARAGLQEHLPKITSQLRHLVFVINDPQKWLEINLAIENIELKCKITIVKSLKEALVLLGKE